jgi:CO/xanthine dehydrogenase Mo-binding subunit
MSETPRAPLGTADPAPLHIVGQDLPRLGLEDKLRGVARYTADLKRPGLLHAKVLRSPHPHARVAAIDTARAEAMPGVRAVLTYRDAPPARIDADLAVLERTVRFVGDEVALVAADTAAQAKDALALIDVRYEVLPAVFDAEQALAPGAPVVHMEANPHGNLLGDAPSVFQRGDVARGFAEAARVFEGTFRTAMHGPVGMETRAALAEWEGEGLTVWKTSRSVHANDREMLARVLGLPRERIRVLCTHMGGGFGNKDEGRIGALAALLARKAGRPVRLEYDREEEFLAGRSRQATVNRLRIGVAANGAPLAIELRSVMNAGAHVASGRNVTRRIGQGPLYLYRCANARYEGSTVYTNRPPGGSFRGLGAPLGHFALEVLVDRIAVTLGIDPLDYRLRFAVPPEGQPGARTTPAGQILPDEPVEGGVPFSSNALRECLEAGAERIGWRARHGPHGRGHGESGPLRRGLGVAMGLYKGGGGRETHAEVRLTGAGRVRVHVGVVDVGQGSRTVLAQIAAEALQVPLERVDMIMADTATTPPAHITAGSSTTFSSGTVVKQAAEDARNRLHERAATLLGAPHAELREGRFVAGGRSLSLLEAMEGLPEDIVGHAVWTSGSTERIVNAFAAHFCEVEVELDSGRIRILRYVAAQDSGRIVNPRLALGQVSGSVLQFLGIALREELLVDAPSGVTLNPGFLEHKSTSIVDFPAVETLFVGAPDPVGPFGAKALGETAVVPVYGAVANAVANATGAWLHEAPFTRERVLRAFAEQGVTEQGVTEQGVTEQRA